MSCSFLKEKAMHFFIEVKLFHYCGERSLTTSMAGGIMEHMQLHILVQPRSGIMSQVPRAFPNLSKSQPRRIQVSTNDGERQSPAKDCSRRRGLSLSPIPVSEVSPSVSRGLGRHSRAPSRLPLLKALFPGHGL